MPAGEDVSVSGMVQSGDGAPIHTIKVTIYREDREVAHAFTSEDGKYVMSVAKGKPITVRFDTHFSLNNAKDWHPSVVANISAMKDVAVDRVLLRVGHGERSAIARTATTLCSTASPAPAPRSSPPRNPGGEPV
jgi:hypothetical protein